MAAAVGTLGKMGIGAANPTTYCLDFRSERFGLKQESINGNGVRGSRSHTVERVRAGLKRISGPVSLEPNAADLHQLFPWCLGSNSSVISGTNKQYDITDALQTRYVQVDRVGKVFTYSTVGVNRATWRCQQGQLLGLDLDLIGCDETVGNAGTFPAINPDVSTNPFELSDLTLSVSGSSVTAKGFELAVANDIDADRFFNSLVMAAIVSRDREVTFKTTLPYGDWTALYNLGAGTGVAVTGTLTNGSVVATFSLPKVVFPPVAPAIEGRSEVMLELEGRAYRYGTPTDLTKNELIWTLDTGV